MTYNELYYRMGHMSRGQFCKTGVQLQNSRISDVLIYSHKGNTLKEINFLKIRVLSVHEINVYLKLTLSC